jgi:hypothetical protein
MKKLALCLLLVACGKSTPTNVPKEVTSDPKSLCVAVMQRARECTNDYIPQLVDLRAKHDMPPGIAAEVAKDRDAVIAQAKQEWATDSQDPNIEANCDRLAPDLTDPSEQASANDCLGKQECVGFSTCVMPLFEKHMHK